jgi:hypothetical protein
MFANWLQVSSGRQICLKAAAELDFQPLFQDRIKSSFLEGQNGWKPPWASNSHAIRPRIVRAICLAAPFLRQPWIERDYQELKQELGLGHYEGRNWRGFHHHASLCIAAYGFLIAERCLFPLSSNSSAGGSKHLRYPQASSRGDLPVRPERHVPHSIASIRRQLAVRLVKALPRCPCCLRQQRGR